MDGRTPQEKLIALGVHTAKKILTFKVLNLDESFYLLQQHLEYFHFQSLLSQIPKEQFTQDRKTSLALITKYSHLRSYAQNVLTYYLISEFLVKNFL